MVSYFIVSFSHHRVGAYDSRSAYGDLEVVVAPP